VDADLEKFFDRVKHDILMDRVGKRVKDLRVVKLIRRYLRAGILDQGICIERDEGTPQGGPLSPLLSNLMLNEVDWELEKRGHSFARYADDLNIYVGSKKAAERAMKSLEKMLGKLKLKINPQKSAVAEVWERKFLGYSLWKGRDQKVRFGISPQSIQRFKEKVKEQTRRSCGKNLDQVVEKLNGQLRGWKNYFHLACAPRTLRGLDEWIRRRLRAIQLQQWKRGKTCYRELVARGVPTRDAAAVARWCRSPWKAARTPGMHRALPNAYFTHELELISLVG
jgi:group II intron reverse transcriptase/maturase